MYLKYLIAGGILLVILFVLYLTFRKQINILIVAFSGKKRVQRRILKECKLNDFLTMSDIYFPIEGGKIRYIDTLIFGNKYIYIVKIIKEIGDVNIVVDDLKWRIIYGKGKKQLTNIDNPLIENRHRIERILDVVPGIERKDMKSIAAFTSTCNFNPMNNENNEFIVHETEIVKAIIEIEKNSPDDIFSPSDVERYANAFYEYAIEAEKRTKKNEKSRKI